MVVSSELAAILLSGIFCLQPTHDQCFVGIRQLSSRSHRGNIHEFCRKIASVSILNFDRQLQTNHLRYSAVFTSQRKTEKR
jgi:hypothetical protein